jgi:hypothetical protein
LGQKSRAKVVPVIELVLISRNSADHLENSGFNPAVLDFISNVNRLVGSKFHFSPVAFRLSPDQMVCCRLDR